MNASRTRSRFETVGWGIAVVVAGLLFLNGLVLYFVVFEEAIEKTLAIIETGLGAVALITALAGFRERTRWAWLAMWALAAELGAITAHAFANGEDATVGVWYLFLTALLVIGQVLARGRRA